MSDASSIDHLKNQLREAGLRATRARLAVLQHLMRTEGPRSHADVVEALGGDGWDRATLYRNLNDLAGAGLVRRIDVDHTWRFELRDAHVDQDGGEVHPHFVCVTCGDIQCLGELTIGGGGASSALMSRVTDVQLRGVCEECD